ncbi:alpha-L-fucosidase domain-containing protein [Pochonia chlamydosporia 170]|uniref:Alpha-L-fucosidase domain-containing protein n=1 Tax=Pochonia chlamydosporia 170 TaxID=1380566 RepID=A0A179EYE7_METCM|nr:alpha-L-fucosidase domain-containing protein [Pochonia chlamydosporia 170]OAQ58198.1 alpha-L-fucosidase domain-containing protein [Pochonia chlamydosporia 170]
MKPVRTILAKTAALQLLGTGLAAIPATPARAVGGAATDWMHNAKFGVMQHWLAEGCPGSDGSCGDPAPTVSSWKYGTPDYQPNVVSVSNHEAPNWYRDAKFGIFIHWGVYAVPAYKNEW